MNFRKVFRAENKRGHNLLFLSGIVLPMLIPFAFGYFGSTDVPDFWLYVITYFILFWLLVFPSLCRLHYYSIFFYRLSIFIGIVVPIILSFHFREVKVIQKSVPVFSEKPIPKINKQINLDEVFDMIDSNQSNPVVKPVKPVEELVKTYVKLDESVDNQVDIFTISSGFFWLLMLILLWIYDGYLISKKPK